MHDVASSCIKAGFCLTKYAEDRMLAAMDMLGEQLQRLFRSGYEYIASHGDRVRSLQACLVFCFHCNGGRSQAHAERIAIGTAGILQFWDLLSNDEAWAC